MSERPKWWKAFLPKKKSDGSKDSTKTSTMGPDFDPFAQRSERQRDSTDAKPGGEHPQQHDPSNGFGDDTFDDSNMESIFNEQTCRRNFKISRSGRFKDKQRKRSTLPPQETERVAAEREDIR